jgi:hypothetical protein
MNVVNPRHVFETLRTLKKAECHRSRTKEESAVFPESFLFMGSRVYRIWDGNLQQIARMPLKTSLLSHLEVLPQD